MISVKLLLSMQKQLLKLNFAKIKKYNNRKQIRNPKPWFNYECQLAKKKPKKKKTKA